MDVAMRDIAENVRRVCARFPGDCLHLKTMTHQQLLEFVSAKRAACQRQLTQPKLHHSYCPMRHRQLVDLERELKKLVQAERLAA